jgi:hypothetical protein
MLSGFISKIFDFESIDTDQYPELLEKRRPNSHTNDTIFSMYGGNYDPSYPPRSIDWRKI